MKEMSMKKSTKALQPCAEVVSYHALALVGNQSSVSTHHIVIWELLDRECQFFRCSRSSQVSCEICWIMLRANNFLTWEGKEFLVITFDHTL